MEVQGRTEQFGLFGSFKRIDRNLPNIHVELLELNLEEAGSDSVAFSCILDCTGCGRCRTEHDGNRQDKSIFRIPCSQSIHDLSQVTKNVSVSKYTKILEPKFCNCKHLIFVAHSSQQLTYSLKPFLTSCLTTEIVVTFSITVLT